MQGFGQKNLLKYMKLIKIMVLRAEEKRRMSDFGRIMTHPWPGSPGWYDGRKRYRRGRGPRHLLAEMFETTVTKNPFQFANGGRIGIIRFDSHEDLNTAETSSQWALRIDLATLDPEFAPGAGYRTACS